jgi:8-oxo-dGTP pyrophosphatase MutT (NUDIX family)
MPTDTIITHYGIYGILVKDHHVLLVKKIRGPYRGLLDLPGGTPEAHESEEETLKREMLEETGIEIISAAKLGIVTVDSPFVQHESSPIFSHTAVIYAVELYNQPDDIALSHESDTHGSVWQNLQTLNDDCLSPLAALVLANYKSRYGLSQNENSLASNNKIPFL